TLNVCPKCSHHMRIGARARIDALLDPEGREEIGAQTRPMDPLKFKDSRKYPERLTEAAKQTGETEALVVMSGTVLSVPTVLACFEFAFMGDRWVRWWASVSPGASRCPSTGGCLSSACRRRAVRACRNPCSR